MDFLTYSATRNNRSMVLSLELVNHLVGAAKQPDVITAELPI